MPTGEQPGKELSLFWFVYVPALALLCVMMCVVFVPVSGQLENASSNCFTGICESILGAV